MEDNRELLAPRTWPLVVALVATLVWLALSVATIAHFVIQGGGAVSPQAAQAGFILSSVLALAAPVALLWLVASQLRDRSGAHAAHAALIAERASLGEHRVDRTAGALVMLEDRITALSGRIESLAIPVESQHRALLAAVTQLEDTGARLLDATGRTVSATTTLGAATPAAIAEAERLTELLARAETDLQRQLGDTETMIAALHVRATEAEAQARSSAEVAASGLAAIGAETVASMNAIRAATDAAQANLTAPLAQLTQGVDAAFARTAAAMDATRDGVHAQTNAMLSSVDQARVTLDHIGGEAARQIKDRLETLLGATGRLGHEIENQAVRTNELADEIGRNFGVLDAKLGNSAALGNTALEAIATRMTEARDAIHRLGEPIAATELALGAVETRIAAVGSSAGETLGALGNALPAALPHIDDMTARLADLHERAGQIATPLVAGGETIAEAQGQLDRARDALDTAAVRLSEELDAARVALAEIETMTGNASLSASTQLLDVFGRVRDIAGQTAGTMRETLSNVVAEAEAALEHAGSSRAEQAFGAPIRAGLAEVEAAHDRVTAAAQAATERVTQRLLALTEVVADVENRIDEVDTRFEVRARNTLAKRSSALVESLQAAAIDMAVLLSFEIEDTAWDDYLKGDKSIFARRVVERVDAGALRDMERHFQHDPEFRTQATHYIEEFEALISHVMPDREGKSLAVTLLSSNIGRLYVALGQARDRFR
jgi:hypothetical protein